MNGSLFQKNVGKVGILKSAIPNRVQELDARARRIAKTYLGAEK